MITTKTASRVAERYVQELDQYIGLACGSNDKCSIGTQNVALLIEAKIGEVLSLMFEPRIAGTNRIPWVGWLVDGRKVEGYVQINLTVTREEVRAWADVWIGR